MAPELNFDFKIKARPKENPLRPEGYSPYSNCSYFCKSNADLVKKYLDALDPAAPSKSYCFPATQYKSVHTVYSQLYHGWRYLIEHEDTPDKKYSELRSKIRIKRKKNRVVLVWALNKSAPTLAGVPLELDGMEIEVEEYGWKAMVRKWCEQAPEKDVNELKINLLPEDQEWLRTFVIPFPSIVVVRADSKGYKLTKNTALAEAIARDQGAGG